jgi:hypothetical protein
VLVSSADAIAGPVIYRHFGVSRQRDRQAGEVPDSGDDALGGVRGQRAVEGPL